MSTWQERYDAAAAEEERTRLEYYRRPSQWRGVEHERAKAALDELVAEAPHAWQVEQAKQELADAQYQLVDLEERMAAHGSTRSSPHHLAARRRVQDAERGLAELEILK